MENKNIFLTRSRVPPARWKEAFPSARITSAFPLNRNAAGEILWLHNLLPRQIIVPPLPKGLKIIVMSDEPNDDQGLMALSQGASGYCNAHATPEVLQEIASVVNGNGLWVGESLLSRLIAGIARRSNAFDGPAPFSHPLLQGLKDRECEVAKRVARGESNKEIARSLDIAERTVKAHLTTVFERLGVRDRLQLALLLNTHTVK